MKAGMTVTSRTDLGSCPECGEQMYLVNDVAVIHLMPACKRFLDMDLDDFLVWCNEERTAQEAAKRPSVGDA